MKKTINLFYKEISIEKSMKNKFVSGEQKVKS